jgi:hypothetical protein
MGAEFAQIPAAVVASGNGMPGCCAKHGQPVALTKKLQLISRPPTWTYVLVLAGALPWLIVVMMLRKTVVAPAWPFCADCVGGRTKQLGIGLGVLALGVVSFIVPMAVMPDSGAGALLVLLGLVLITTGFILAVRAGWRFQSRAEASKDGLAVLVRDANPQFVQQIPAPQPV